MKRISFDVAELTPIAFNTARNGLKPLPVYNTPISSKEHYKKYF